MKAAMLVRLSAISVLETALVGASGRVVQAASPGVVTASPRVVADIPCSYFKKTLKKEGAPLSVYRDFKAAGYCFPGA